MERVATQISEEDEALLAKLEAEQGVDRSVVLRRFIHNGLNEWRQEQALEELEAGNLTLRKAAEVAGVGYVEMVRLASEAGIDVHYDIEDLERDVERIQ